MIHKKEKGDEYETGEKRGERSEERNMRKRRGIRMKEERNMRRRRGIRMREARET